MVKLICNECWKELGWGEKYVNCLCDKCNTEKVDKERKEKAKKDYPNNETIQEM